MFSLDLGAPLCIDTNSVRIRDRDGSKAPKLRCSDGARDPSSVFEPFDGVGTSGTQYTGLPCSSSAAGKPAHKAQPVGPAVHLGTRSLGRYANGLLV
jgi:hypothetical protein